MLATMSRSEFFESPAPREAPEPREPRLPPWFQAPRGELPCAVSLGGVLARSEEAVVGVGGGLAFTTGFELSVYAFSFGEDLEGDRFGRGGPFDRTPTEGGEIAPWVLRIGIEYADGSKLMSTLPRRRDEIGGDDEADHPPTMGYQRGTGWHRESHQVFWCWPLPPPGPMQLICEWPAMEIDLTRREFDAQSILDASARAEAIFSPT
jgi:hypothetical protein